MEENLLNTNESGKCTSCKKKRGRPKKKIEPTPLTDKLKYTKWVIENRKEFFNYGQKTPEFLNAVYEVYNYTFETNKIPTGCNTCHADIISAVKRYYFNEI